MTKQIIFGICLIITLAVFFWTFKRIWSYLKLTKPYPIGDYGKRFKIMMEVAIGQTKIFRFPFVGNAACFGVLGIFWLFWLVV